MTIRGFCRKRGIGDHSFYLWRRRLDSKQSVRFALVKTIQTSTPPIELFLPGGERLCIQSESKGGDGYIDPCSDVERSGRSFSSSTWIFRCAHFNSLSNCAMRSWGSETLMGSSILRDLLARFQQILNVCINVRRYYVPLRTQREMFWLLCCRRVSHPVLSRPRLR